MLTLPAPLLTVQVSQSYNRLGSVRIGLPTMLTQTSLSKGHGNHTKTRPYEFIGHRLCCQPPALLDREAEIWLGPLQKSLDSEASEFKACSLRAIWDSDLTGNDRYPCRKA